MQTRVKMIAALVIALLLGLAGKASAYPYRGYYDHRGYYGYRRGWDYRGYATPSWRAYPYWRGYARPYVYPPAPYYDYYDSPYYRPYVAPGVQGPGWGFSFTF
jgi:hypothetical protein